MGAFRTASPGATRVGWIGTGVMGASMCGHLLDRGYELTVTTRTRSKAEGLLDRGATWADDPAGVAARSDVVFSIVGFPADVREIILGDGGVLSSFGEGKILIDMTTSEPSLAVEIAGRARTLGGAAVDAPVSGGDVGAREARLSIMVGGDEEPVRAVWPMFEAMGKNIRRMGGPGAGQHTKMSNQILIASTMIGLVESLVYGWKAGLDPNDLVAAIGKGAAGCWSLDNYAPRILRRDFEPGFFVEHFVKDMGIALREAGRMNLCLPGLALAHQLYTSLVAKGKGRLGTQALALALEDLCACEIGSGA
jgi:3-hydroxyisobutyrate dehydrogenase